MDKKVLSKEEVEKAVSELKYKNSLDNMENADNLAYTIEHQKDLLYLSEHTLEGYDNLLEAKDKEIDRLVEGIKKVFDMANGHDINILNYLNDLVYKNSPSNQEGE